MWLNENYEDILCRKYDIRYKCDEGKHRESRNIDPSSSMIVEVTANKKKYVFFRFVLRTIVSFLAKNVFAAISSLRNSILRFVFYVFRVSRSLRIPPFAKNIYQSSQPSGIDHKEREKKKKKLIDRSLCELKVMKENDLLFY